MTIELWMLLASAVLMQAMPMFYGPGFIHALGPRKMLGNRDNMPAVEGWFARVKRAHANLAENLIPFAAVVLVADAAGIHNGWTIDGAILFFLARIAHVACYAIGVGLPRTIAYIAGVLGTLIIAVVVAFNA